MSSVKSIGVVVAASLCGLLAPAQQHGSFAWRELPGATAAAIGLAWQQAGDGGRAGIARLLAECRLVRASAAAPSVRTCLVHVDAERSCVVGVVDVGDVAGARAFLDALLDDSLPLSDDTIARLAARVALAADDAAMLYPGDVMAARAAAAFGAGQAAVIDVLSLLDLAPARVRELLQAPTNIVGAGVGAPGDAIRQMTAALAWPPPSPEWSDAGRLQAAPKLDGVTSETHSRCDAPWVMAAFAVPPAVARPALAVALEVARARAVRAMRSRGAEPGAHAPLVAWSWLTGESLVRFHRRAEDPMQRLPGERPQAAAAFAAAAARREIEALLRELCSQPPSPTELAAACGRVVAEHGLAAERAPVVDAALLPGIAVVELLRTHRGIDPAALAAVTPVEAHAALVTVLQADGAYWHELLPLAREDRHWPWR